MIRAFMDDDLAAVWAIQSKCPAAAQWQKDDYLRLAGDPCGMILVAEVERLTRIPHAPESFSSGQRKGGASAPLSERSRLALRSRGPQSLGLQTARAVGQANGYERLETAELKARPSPHREPSGPERSEVVGFAAFHRVIEEAELRNLAVAPPHQRQGVARSLLQEGIRKLKEAGVRHVFLEVRASNHPALGLYTSLGFRLHSTRKDYYQGPAEDALLMALEILSVPGISRLSGTEETV